MFRGTDLEFRVVRSHPVFADFLFSPLIVGSDSMACSNRVVTVVPMPFRLQKGHFAFSKWVAHFYVCKMRNNLWQGHMLRFSQAHFLGVVFMVCDLLRNFLMSNCMQAFYSRSRYWNGSRLWGPQCIGKPIQAWGAQKHICLTYRKEPAYNTDP